MPEQKQQQELISRVRHGDANALESLIAYYYPAVFSYFYKNTGSYHGSKDLTQEVFIKMAAGAARYKPTKPFKNWLFTIASNHLKNHWRTLAWQRESPLPCPEAGGALPGIEQQVEQQVLLKAALGRLPPEQRDALILRFYCGFSLRDIAGIIGVPETTVKARIRRSLDKLRKELASDDQCF